MSLFQKPDRSCGHLGIGLLVAGCGRDEVSRFLLIDKASSNRGNGRAIRFDNP